MPRHHQTKILDAVGAGATTVLGDPYVVVDIAGPWGFTLEAQNQSGTTPSLNSEIQTSFDGGVTWVQLVAFASPTTGDSSETVVPTVPPGTLIRHAASFSGTSPVYNFQTYAVGAISVRAL